MIQSFFYFYFVKTPNECAGFVPACCSGLSAADMTPEAVLSLSARCRS